MKLLPDKVAYITEKFWGWLLQTSSFSSRKPLFCWWFTKVGDLTISQGTYGGKFHPGISKGKNHR
jgi:hypothetical protein